MKKILKKILLPLVLLAGACDMDKDLQDPNQVSLASGDVNLILNAVELDFADFFWNSHGSVAPLIRHNAMTGGFRYQTAYQPQNQNTIWQLAYSSVLINAATVQTLAAEKEFTNHIAVAKILSAYTYITLVDLFGDVPEVDALKAAEGEFNPAPTSGSDVYAHAITMLNDARTLIEAEGPDLARDIYFGGDMALWTALANTLELKAWMNISTLSARKDEANSHITTLLAGDLIDEPGEDFVYTYSATTVPDSRHPLYNQYYGPNEGQAGGYIGTGFMYELYRGKPDASDPNNAAKFSQDPRWRYYFSRQAGSIEQINTIDPKAIGCTPGKAPQAYRDGNYPFCVFDPGFYGRDHGDASGTPPDAPVITAAGAYPAGGRADNVDSGNANFKSQTQRGQGANGAGILPIYMSFYTDFLVAEFAARNGDVAGARAALLDATLNSINYVKTWSEAKGQKVSVEDWTSESWIYSHGDAIANPNCVDLSDPDLKPLEGAELSICKFNRLVDNYLTAVAYQFDNETDKLKAVGRETWIAAWGNGVEAYNSYRRTGGPTHMQPTIQTGAGPWLRSLVYSANYVNLNLSASQKPADQVSKVFWDGNPEDLN